MAESSILQNCDECLQEGNVYEALQMIKAAASRYAKRKKNAQAIDLVVKGIQKLCSFKELKLAADLSDELFRVLDFTKSEATKEILSAIKVAVHSFPDGSVEQLKSAKAALRWSSALSDTVANQNGKGHPELHFLVAAAILAGMSNSNATHNKTAPRKYSEASRHFLWSKQPEAFANMVLQFASLGIRGEEDLFVAREVLRLIACRGPNQEGSKEAQLFFSKCMENGKVSDTPLINFVRLLLEVTSFVESGEVTRADGKKLFIFLLGTYEKMMLRDPFFGKCLTSIANQYLS
eukprot:g4827.t1